MMPPILFLALLAGAVPASAGDNPLAGLFLEENLRRAHVQGVTPRPGPEPGAVTLDFPASARPGILRVPVPAAARDWSQCRTFTFRFTSTSTIRWEMEIRNARGEVFGWRVQPYAHVPVKAAISRDFLTHAYKQNKAYKAHWLSNWRNHIDLTAVEWVEVRMAPNAPVTLTLGPLVLSPRDEEDEAFLEKPIIDEFGQYGPLDWPGKFRSWEQLRAAWKQEDSELAKAEDSGFCQYGGWRESKRRATGFFRVEQVDGRWWFVDPDGHLYLSLGPCCVQYRNPSPSRGRDFLFSSPPPVEDNTVDIQLANVRRRYGAEDFVNEWKAQADRRLRAWGCTSIGNWSTGEMFESPRAPFPVPISLGGGGKNWHLYPDVYSDAWRRQVEADARRQCARFRDEPYLLGYFVGNEVRWPTRNLVETIRRDPESSATQAFVRRYLGRHGGTAAARDALLGDLARTYFQALCDAIRKADPNHLILGIRWAGSPSDIIVRANAPFDVYSLNSYRFEPPREELERAHRILNKPILIGEFHFGAAARGYAPSLVMVRDQAERGAAYQYFVERGLTLPMLVGAHWFQLYDQPVTGRFDGENYNLGILTQQDTPYPEMVRALQETHRRAYRVHAGEIAPTTRRVETGVP